MKRAFSDLSVSRETRRKWDDILFCIEEVKDDIVFQLSDDAKALYRDYYNELEDKMHRAKDDAVKEMLAKIEVGALRWSLITSILAGEYDTERAEISGESMEYSIACCRYFEKTGLRAISAVNGQSPQLTKKDLIKALKLAYPGLNQRKLADAIGASEAYVSKVLRK